MAQRKPYTTYVATPILCFSQNLKITVEKCLRSIASVTAGPCVGCVQGQRIKDRFLELRRLHNSEKQGRRVDIKNRPKIKVHTTPVARVYQGTRNGKNGRRGKSGVAA